MIIIFIVLEAVAFFIGAQSPNTIVCETCQECDSVTKICPDCSCPNNAGAAAIPFMLIGIIPNLIISYLITNIIFAMFF